MAIWNNAGQHGSRTVQDFNLIPLAHFVLFDFKLAQVQDNSITAALCRQVFLQKCC